MKPFFRNNMTATDSSYIATRNPSGPNRDYLEKGRSFIERIWENCYQFVDPDAAERAANDLASVFWELYLAYALSRAGITLVPRSDREPKWEGPDLLSRSPDVWLEAVMPTNGDVPNALKTPEVGKSFRIPTNDFVLRLRSVIETKAAQIQKYTDAGYIKKGQAAIVAVSSARLEFQFNELPVPRIVRAVFGVGDVGIEIDRETRTVVGHFVEHRDHIVKVSGKSIDTGVFLDSHYAHVSAVVYCASNWVSHPEQPGEDFILVRNPHASTPIPEGWFPSAVEYCEDAGLLKRTQPETGRPTSG